MDFYIWYAVATTLAVAVTALATVFWPGVIDIADEEYKKSHNGRYITVKGILADLKEAIEEDSK